MIKRDIFAKTQRLGTGTWEWLLTEKMDGSTLCLFMLNGGLCIAQRKTIFMMDEMEGAEGLYPGVAEWLATHAEDLARRIYPGSVVCGEWLGMGKVKYPGFFSRYNMFAKARLVPGRDLSEVSIDESTLCYDPDDFHWVFSGEGIENPVIPDYIGTVPVIARTRELPTVAFLDAVYAEYAERVQRPVEGIIITQTEVPARRCKYVRMKNNKATRHITFEEMQKIVEEKKKHTGKR